MPLILLDDSSGALCLDGTPGGFYIYRNQSSTKWIIFFQGGGWCYDLDDCVARSKTGLGSSSHWPSTMQDDEAHDMFSPDPNVNPFFYSFNKVYMQYCDGASFAGTAGAVRVGQTTLHFSGYRVLKEIVSTLRSKFGLSSATEVLLSGCSAGGLATYLHADSVQAMMPSSVLRFKAAPISGFFLDMSTLSGNAIYNSQMRNVFKMQNASVDADCMAANSNAPEQCMFAEHVWPFISTPILATNSMYDSWSLGNIFLVDELSQWKACIMSNSSGCTSDQIKILNGVWQTEFLSRILRANTLYVQRNQKNPNGVFLDSLLSHCEAGFVWNSLTIEQTSVSQAWGRFFNDLQSTHRYIGCTLKENAPFFCANLEH